MTAIERNSRPVPQYSAVGTATSRGRATRARGPVKARVTAIALGLVLAGCGTGENRSDAVQPDDEVVTSSPTTAATAPPSGNEGGDPEEGASDVIVNVTIRGNEVQPIARRVRAHSGQRIVFQVDADRAGGLHVHSSPEQTIDFSKGSSILTTRIKVPGVVDVEEHESDALIAKIEVR